MLSYNGRRNSKQCQTDKVLTIDMETIISRFYHIIHMIVTHSAIDLVRCCHGQMSLIAVSYPIIFIHEGVLYHHVSSFCPESKRLLSLRQSERITARDRYDTGYELICAICRSIWNVNKDGRANGVCRLPNIKVINKAGDYAEGT